MQLEHYGDNFDLVIPMEDEFVHTPERRFCDDPTCGCHDDPDLIAAVNSEYRAGLLTEREATRLVQGRQL